MKPRASVERKCKNGARYRRDPGDFRETPCRLYALNLFGRRLQIKFLADS